MDGPLSVRVEDDLVALHYADDVAEFPNQRDVRRDDDEAARGRALLNNAGETVGELGRLRNNVPVNEIRLVGQPIRQGIPEGEGDIGRHLLVGHVHESVDIGHERDELDKARRLDPVHLGGEYAVPPQRVLHHDSRHTADGARNLRLAPDFADTGRPHPHDEVAESTALDLRSAENPDTPVRRDDPGEAAQNRVRPRLKRPEPDVLQDQHETSRTESDRHRFTARVAGRALNPDLPIRNLKPRHARKQHHASIQHASTETEPNFPVRPSLANQAPIPALTSIRRVCHDRRSCCNDMAGMRSRDCRLLSNNHVIRSFSRRYRPCHIPRERSPTGCARAERPVPLIPPSRKSRKAGVSTVQLSMAPRCGSNQPR